MKRKINLLAFFSVLFLALLASSLSWAKEVVYMNDKEAIEWAFPKSEKVEKVFVELSREKSTDIEAKTGGRLYSSDKQIYIGRSDEEIDGYAVITNEVGKFELITFIVKLSPKLVVEKVAVMTYRESRGGEISRKRFQEQYKGKKKTDPFQINRDIISITGATMSVRAMNRGIRKVFAVIDFYLNQTN